MEDSEQSQRVFPTGRTREHRVALVVPGFGGHGGVPRAALFLQRVLRESGRYRPDLISLPLARNDPGGVQLTSPATWLRGVRTEEREWEGHRFSQVGAFWSDLEFQRFRPRPALTALLRGYDLIQIVAGTPAWALAARGVGRPVALQVATLVAEERRALLATARGPLGFWRRAMTRLTTRFEAAALGGVDVAFVENDWMLEHLRKQMGASRVVFAPLGVDTDYFRPGEHPGAESRFVLAVGRFGDPRKQLGVLFEAFRRLRERLPDPPRLVLAGGESPSPADWSIAQRLGVRDQIEFREAPDDDELLSLYQRAAVFALSSDEEGLGIALIEAMACGVPAVSTDCGGPRTSVVDGQTGFLVPRGDADALASRIEKLLTDAPLHLRMGRAARARAVECFSLPVTGRPFLTHYDALLGIDT